MKTETHSEQSSTLLLSSLANFHNDMYSSAFFCRDSFGNQEGIIQSSLNVQVYIISIYCIFHLMCLTIYNATRTSRIFRKGMHTR